MATETEWTMIPANGDATELPDVPDDAKHIAGWQRRKADCVNIFSDGSDYWVTHSSTGRLVAVEEWPSEEEAFDRAKEIRSEF